MPEPKPPRDAPEDEERIPWKVSTVVEKWDSQEAYDAGDPPDVQQSSGNIILDEGGAILLDLLIGAGGASFNNANARIGVGDSNTTASAAQTGLQGSNTLYRVMEAGYPSRSGRTVTWRSVFGASEANFSWQEWSVDNGAGVNLNRKVAGFGVKVSGAVWTITVSCSA